MWSGDSVPEPERRVLEYVCGISQEIRNMIPYCCGEKGPSKLKSVSFSDRSHVEGHSKLINMKPTGGTLAL